MDAKLREDLFRRYVASLDRRLEDDGGGGKPGKGGVSPEGWGGGRHGDSEALLSTATALLGAYQPEPAQRFRMVRFYEVVEKALRCQRGGSLRGLERAFRTLETLTTNLLLFPWKKEFRCIKTFTGPYVYHLQSAVCDADLRSLLRSIGYARDHELQFHARDHPGGPAHLRQLAFELFLAQAECRLLREVVALARGAASETEALELRRGCRDDAAGCAEALRRRDSLGADMARLSVRPSTTPAGMAPDSDHRAPHPHHLRRGGGGRPSKSVDVTDGAGHWHAAAAAASKPVLKASLSLRKEPLFVDAEEDAKDEILRPGVGGGLGSGLLALTGAPLSVAAPPSLYAPSPSASAVAVADFFPVQSPPPPAEAYSSYHLSSLDEIDLYTERGGGGGGGGLGGGRQTPSSRPPSREPRDSWVLKPHGGGGGGGGVKCQCCGLVCSSALASPCQRCDAILCAACHDVEPSPCCGLLLQDYPPSSSSSSSKPRPLDGYVPVKEKLSVYSSNTHSSAHHHPHPLTLTHSHTHPHPQMAEKPLMAAKLFPGKALVVAPTQTGMGVGGVGGSRCGFCNKPGSSHTCVSCSKVSCDTCMLLYAKDVCTRKNPQHSFLPNHQLNYSKAGSVSHLVYR